MAREVRALARLRDVPAKTRDGQRVALQLNLELPRELEQATGVGAEGIGLLRTEFMYMNRPDLPDEEEQYQVRSEEHTSELQSLMRTSSAVFSLKKKTNRKRSKNMQYISCKARQND